MNKINHCIDCGKPIKKTAKRCKKCMYLSPEYKAKMSKVKMGSRHTPATRQKMSKAKMGEKAPLAKLTEKDVIQIKLAFERGESNSNIAKRYKVHQYTIWRIKTGKAWRHVNIQEGQEGMVTVK